ncbi:MAG: hypothetical protein JWN70_4996 [Planctomycetaceae bacterium]|nr:hypothetical protein [Planctomycetaceae bacterium]
MTSRSDLCQFAWLLMADGQIDHRRREAKWGIKERQYQALTCAGGCQAVAETRARIMIEGNAKKKAPSEPSLGGLPSQYT